ncbi:MAG: leucyl aminopeptidase, partial [Verrucomicrobia bacterium]|nr:leucyl aminopeptidase [Verrucomicrobiota bacterium]
MSHDMNSPRLSVVSRPPRSCPMVEFHFQGTPRIRGVNEIEFNGSRNTTCWVREGDRPTLHVGLGPMAEEMADRFRQSCGVAAKALLRLGQSEFCLNLQGFETHAQAAAEGVLLAAYRFEDFKEPSARRKNPLRGLHAWVGARAMEAAKNAFARGGVLAEATNYARAVGNLPPNVIYPETLAEKALELAKEVGVECRVWDERALRREGFGGILAVGGGSIRAPRLIELKSRAAARKAPVVVVVGKAVTFDTGGVSIKPAERMEEMKWDKMGGCAVLGIVRAVKRLKLPIHLVGLIPSAENMPGASAYRPSDLVRTWDGKVIEVLNTDAEGRVILADALAYGRQTHKPDLMIDLAT